VLKPHLHLADGFLRNDAAFWNLEIQDMRTGWIDTFECDLTDEQKRLCEWIAGQAQAGMRRICYRDAQAVLGVQTEKELTCMLRSMRERLDRIHDMVQSPIVNTTRPYFDVPPHADHIWRSYRRAEEESMYSQREVFGLQEAVVHC
jgi:hypothetical protein